MKPARASIITSLAAAFAMTAAAGQAQLPKLPSRFSASVSKEFIKMNETYQTCTKDGHLFTAHGSNFNTLFEQAPTEEGLRQVARDYEGAEGKYTADILRAFGNNMTASELTRLSSLWSSQPSLPGDPPSTRRGYFFLPARDAISSQRILNENVRNTIEEIQRNRRENNAPQKAQFTHTLTEVAGAKNASLYIAAWDKIRNEANGQQEAFLSQNSVPECTPK